MTDPVAPTAYQMQLKVIDGKLGIYSEWESGGYWEPVNPPAGYVLVNADMLAAAIGSLPSPPSVLHPEESAAAILVAIQEQTDDQ